MTRNKLINTAIAATVSLGVSVGAAGTAQAAAMEKCFGVVKAKQNDCGNAKHGCAGQATRNGSGIEWIYLPKGACKRIVHGSTKPMSNKKDKR